MGYHRRAEREGQHDRHLLTAHARPGAFRAVVDHAAMNTDTSPALPAGVLMLPEFLAWRVAAIQAAPMRAGSREPAASPWLSCSSDPVATVCDSGQAEPRLGPWALIAGAAIAPATTLGAFMDWWTHLAGSPAKQLEVASEGIAQWRRAWEVAVDRGECATAAAGQALCRSRVAVAAVPRSDASLPFRRGMVAASDHWGPRRHASSRTDGELCSAAVAGHGGSLEFVVTNPVVQRQTLQECGLNLFRGAAHVLEDAWRDAADLPPAGAGAFEIGRVAAMIWLLNHPKD